ncbi:MAG TPA: hypothetical protein PLA19_03080 [Candidatus Pacearchaeota archaeon]|jgi:hypothetical protein|nr:hypothetical protein [Candidatus Pacearchaeota archaeon]
MMEKQTAAQNNTGFVLMEFLIYLFLFGLIFAGLFGGIFAAMETMGKNDARVMARHEGEFLLAKIEREKDIASFDAPGGVLALAGDRLNNSQTFVSDFEISLFPENLARASFVLTAKDRGGREFSQKFMTIYRLPQ